MKGGKRADNKLYTSIDNRLSDHRPVVAQYEFSIGRTNIDKKEAIRGLILNEIKEQKGNLENIKLNKMNL